jgi:hypothetical protein
MVDPKRVERKLPLLITDAPWYSGELDRNEYQLSKFKRGAPEKYALHTNNIIKELSALRQELDQFVANNKGKNGKRALF